MRAFFEKNRGKKLLFLGVQVVKREQSNEQKFFAERRPRAGLFYKKATAYFGSVS